MTELLNELEKYKENLSALSVKNKSIKKKSKRLEILNTNLENQVEILNKQLSETIALLEKAEKREQNLIIELNELREKSIKYNNVNKQLGDIINNAHGYAQSLIGSSVISSAEDKTYITQVNDLLGKISAELDVANNVIAKKK